jgi:SAM-dependent methyltransferase
MQILELASRGYLGVGLDLSLPMLSRAAEEAQSRGLKINFLHADMREMNFDGSFDAVVCLGTTLGYFDDETNRKIAERLCRALKPGGVLLLEVVNRDHVIGAQPNLIWFEGDGCVCMEESDFNFFASRLHVKRTVILDNGRQTETEYALRLYSLHELGQILNGAGFRVTEVSGRQAIPGVFFGQQSPNILIVAERRVAPEAPTPPGATD